MPDWLSFHDPVVLAAIWAFVLAVGGALLTDIGAWYKALRKPPWQPPDWLFGPAWTTIFILSAWGGVNAWNANPDPGSHATIAALFVINGLLNLIWSPLFFRLRRPDWSLIECAPFWLSILAMVLYCGSISPLAGWLIVPYISWVSFATILNWEVVRLNRPFGRRSPA